MAKKKSKPALSKKVVHDMMLTNLNEFMKEFNIDAVHFGSTHSIKKTKGKKAKDTTTPKKKAR